MIFFRNNFLLYFLPLSLLPIILHLLSNKQRKRIKFTYVYLINRVVNQYLPKKKIVELLIVILRCLIVFLMILFFSGPVAYVDPYQSSKLSLVVLIDNSFSMHQKVGNKTKFDICKDSLIKFMKEIKKYDVTPSLILVFNEQVVPLKRVKTLQEIFDDLENIKISFCKSNLATALEYTFSYVKDNLDTNCKILIFTDFAEHLFDNNIFLSTVSISKTIADISFCYPEVEVSNYFVEDLNVSNKDDFLEIDYKTSFSGQAKQEESTPVKLLINESIVGNMYISKLTNRYKFRYPFGRISHQDNFGCLILPKDGLTEDNKFYFSLLKINGSSDKILCVINEPITLRGISSKKFYFEKFKAIDKEIEIKDYSENLYDKIDINKYNFIILIGLTEISLLRNVRDDKVVIVFPDERCDLESYDEVLTGLEFVRLQNEYGEGINLSLGDDENWNVYLSRFEYDKIFVKKRILLTVRDRYKWKVILRYKDGTPAVVKNDNTYVFSFSPDKEWTNFILKPIFVGIFDKIFKQEEATSKDIKPFYYISEQINFAGIRNVKQVDINGDMSDNDKFFEKNYSEIRFYKPGVYEIDIGDKKIPIAINISPDESNINLATETKAKKFLSKFVKGNILFFRIDKDKHYNLIQWCIGKELSGNILPFLVLFFVLETILSRLSKKML
ncbi:MAG: VWA domain-containing protein [Endomicrobia bacterium]|nr:VWA domain-containing protein [Endomicrobiia bacterium]